VPTNILHLHSQRIEAYCGNSEQFDKIKTVQEFIARAGVHRPVLVQCEPSGARAVQIVVTLNFPDVEHLNPPALQLREVTFKHIHSDKVIFTTVNLIGDLSRAFVLWVKMAPGKPAQAAQAQVRLLV